MELLEKRANRRSIAPSVDSVVDTDTVRALQALLEEVLVDEKVRRYIIALARATREDNRVEVGVSPRGIQRLFETARANAVINGREYVAPDDVKRLTEPTMDHRLVLTTETAVEGIQPTEIIRQTCSRIDVPAVAPEANNSLEDET